MLILRQLLTGAAIIGLSMSAAPAEPMASTDASSSPFLRCDGRPGHTGAAGVFGKLLVITATAGVGGLAFSKPDTSKRVPGAEGAAACDAAIKAEGNEERRMELALARTIHLIEAQNFEGALASARSAPGVAPGLANDLGFRHGLLPSAQYLEAYSLVRLGRLGEAQATAIRMASALPYDLVANKRAVFFLRLSPSLSPEKAAVLDHLIRLDPEELIVRAWLKSWNGDDVGAANDMSDLRNIFLRFNPAAHVEALEGTEAVFRMMAGDAEGSANLMKAARDSSDALVAAGQGSAQMQNINATDEDAAFVEVGRALAAGHAAQARMLFTARAHWLAVPQSVVFEMSTRLRKGADPAELTGLLADDPLITRDKGLKTLASTLAANDASGANLYGILLVTPSSSYQALASSVWKIGDRPAFLVRRTGTDTAGYDVINVVKPPTPTSDANGEALLLHAALIAQSRGKTGFQLGPNHKYLYLDGVLFDPGPSGPLPASTVFNAAQVVAALSQEFPKPIS